MLNGKKRSYLKSLANGIKSTNQIGKDGISKEFLDQLDDQLRAREIVKVTILDNCGIDAKEAANHVCEAIRAEFVQAIGNKFTIYKRNNEKPVIVFPGHEQAKAKDKRTPVSKRLSKKEVNELIAKSKKRPSKKK
ncbi:MULTISPECIES: YhbY family RNA-binding protein [Peptostreptococcus]|jgi:RNA-binding protein|uniref:RNA-binding protein YhbY n=2 Tax=Peptostreptococcus anaerobius TaxID=1261 RepID=A0A135YWN8_9FIRM|nr:MULTISPECIES: YhbY family RNA-binding protein [Peptostreptococcus]EFD05578.1 putative RNA-binding protein, YhbY family [Peptostreptococcus anaerobius 653-L]EKX94775.1 RNA-binding protein, YhbY family [Peptostreptococcus anaerobius VPI 4330 = DSM 2949]KXB72998.1 RNA-binding protein, YhbY family [Peptostreptococcus anaerobius]KXI13787.1 RNA-binding protein, YhbY family [Peptostreptococcus anaerobius]MBS5597125.1 YhbY family RNA-binding protein [Peptostreptococcus sp.]